MRVYGMSLKSETVSDLKLPLGALYLLASPNVPETARTEILERAAAGDRLTSTEVKRVITDAKQAKTDDEIDPAGAEDVVVLRNWRTVTQTVVSAYLAHLDGQEPANDVDLDQRDDGHDLAGRSAKTDSRPEPETLIAHWQRDEEGRTALLDAVGAKAFRNAMSKEFSKALRAELPANPFAKLCEMDPGAIASRIFETVGATKSRVISEKLQALVLPKGKKPGKPSFKTLNLTANRAQERNRFRH